MWSGSRSVVRIEPALIENGDFSIVAFGSGSIVDRRGLILTNFHVIDPALGYDVILIAVTGALDERPREKFLAEVQVADATLDLAVLRIVSDLSGAAVKPSTLNLTEIPQGDSDIVRVLDRVLAFGYPDIGDETLTVTAGAISGFLSQEGVTARRSWFKTDTTISFGNSGGAAVDEDGFLVGIPTQGNFDEGGAIAHLRPLSLALPLIDAARRGEVIAASGSRSTSVAQISNIAFAADVSEEGELLDRSSEFGSEQDLIFYSFDFQGMTPQTSLSEVWRLDGDPLDPLGLTHSEWTLGPAGTFLDGIQSGGGFSPEIYTLEIWVDGELVASRSLSVAVEFAAPLLSNLVVAAHAGILGDPVGVADDFVPGIPTLFAFFDYENGASIPFVDDVWYFEGERIELARPSAGPWDGGDRGRSFVSLTDDRGFGPGRYRVEIYFGDQLADSTSFSVEAGLALPDDGVRLALGEVVGGSLASGDVDLFRLQGFDTPPGPGQGLLVKLDGDGDADVYVKRGSPPGADELNQSWNEVDFQAPFDMGSDETVFIPGAAPGDWWIAVVGYDLENTYSLRASISADGAAGVEELTIGDSIGGILPLEGDFDEFVVEVPAGSAALTVSITGEGDADLYVAFGAPVDEDALNQSWRGPDIFAPYSLGSDEFVSVPTPLAGVWFIRVEAFVGQSSYTLTINEGSLSSPGELGSDPFLDDLYTRCESGDLPTCDQLYFEAPVESSYETFGDTCGGRQSVGTGLLCVESLGAGGPSAPDGEFGDEPLLDDLYLRCSAGDLGSCDELYFQSPIGSAYEEFGDTCGGLQAVGSGDLCAEAFGGSQAPTPAFSFGDDALLDSLWISCAAGDFAACDQLYFDSPSDSDYEFFGDTCGGLQPAGSGALCDDTFAGSSFTAPGTFGSDPVLDALYLECSNGDLTVCDDLYFESPPDSAYEAFADTCAGLQPAETGRLCADLA